MKPHRTGRFCVLGLVLILASFFTLHAKPIKLRTGTIEPRPGGGAQTAPQNRNEEGLYLVQLKDQTPRNWRAEVQQTGAQILRYVPDDTFVMRLPPDTMGRVRALPFVEWVGDYQPEHKVHPRLAANLAAGVQEHNVSVLLSRMANGAEVNASRAAFSALRQQSRLSFGSVLRGTVSSARLAELARSHAVIWIEPGPKFKLVDEISSKIVAGDGGPGMSLAQAFGFDGNGVTVAVPDSGLNNGDAATMHPDLFGRVAAFFHYGTLTDAADEHSHGTHVAGIIAGDGATGEIDEFGALYGLGVAPRARIIAQRIFDGLGNFEAPPSFERLTRDAVRAGADIASNSWGDDTQGRYDLSAAEFDALVRDADSLAPGAQQFIIEFSAGNAGPGAQTMDSPAVAKNVIATGASQNDRFDFIIYAEGQDSMTDFSSRGPCEDGRIKPDVVAPGSWIASLKSASASDENAWAPISDNYMYQGGTSQAGPHVSGAAAVLVQYFREVYGMPRPSPALIKAALINSAVDMDDSFGTDPIPNADEGWGRVDLTSIVANLSRYEFMDQTQLLSAGQVFEHRVIAASSFVPLRITLAYTDYPGFPGAIPALVNDLDLEVVGPDGTVYRGNQFEAGESIPDTLGRDNINNVEAVYITVPIAGEYIVRVRAVKIVEDSRIDTQGADQDFALVISADIPPPGSGLVILDRAAYRAPDVINVKVIDSDLAGQPTVNVQVRSTTDSTGLTLQLRASNSGGSFTGSVATVTGGSSGLRIAHGDLIEAIYQDANQGPRTATARADLLPPVLTNIASTNAFGRMLVRWDSDEPATSIVRYGTNASLTSSATNLFLTDSHEVALENLIAGRTYFFMVVSADEAGNRTTNNNGGALYSFVAVPASAVLLVDAYVEDPDSIPIPRSAYTGPLDEIGISYEVWDVNLLGSPQLANLRPFQVVIWRITDSIYVQDSTLSSQEQTAIQAYVNGGGAFFMGSMELLSRLGDVPFRRDVLKVQQFLVNPNPLEPCVDCDEDHGVPSIRGNASDPVTRGMQVDLDYSMYPSIEIIDFGPDFSDTFTPTTNAAGIFTETASGRPCGMKYPRTGQDSTGRVVFLSFPFDTIPATGSAPDNRTAILRNVLQFLAPGYGGFGTLIMDRDAYTLPDIVTLELGDSDLAGAGQVTINAYSSSFGTPVPVTVTETRRPGLFRGTFTLVPPSDPAGPGRVRAASGDTVFAEYLDGSSTVQAKAIVDTGAPLIVNVSAEPDYESALIMWQTTEPADALVQYGTSLLLDRTEYMSELSDSHELNLTGLLPDRVYYYKVVSRDIAGNVVEDDNNGQMYSFRTLRPITPPWYDNLESGATDWSTFDADDTQSTWTLGVPPDPWDGNAWGSNLDGRPIDYSETFLISPALDLTGGNDASLHFYHSYDFTGGGDFDIQGGQLLIITNPLTAPVLLQEYYYDAQAWAQEDIDLTPYVGHVVFIVWYYQLFAIEDVIATPGWLVDDVSVSLSTVTPGAIRVTNNLAQARFVLSGRGVDRPGQGLNTVFSNLPPADYSISWTEVPYYTSPPDQTQTLDSGASLTFTGNYTFPDANNNGMSDIWETEYFGSVAPDRTRTTDTDNDGSTDYAEFNAGTDPKSATSYLRVLQPAIMPGNMIRLQWTSAPGRAYRVEGSPDGRAWSPATDWIQTASANASVTLPMSGALMFRVAVRP